MDIQKNPWKKGSLRPNSSRQKQEQQQKENTINYDNNGGMLGVEITGTKIAKQSEIGLMKFNLNRTNKSQRSNKNDDQEIEEEKWNSGNKKQSQQKQQQQQYQLMDETMYSDVSNMYIDDLNIEKRNSQNNFGTFMRDKIDNNPDAKRVYDNYILDEKRREHEEELKKQTSKPFQVNKGRMSSSATNASKQRSAISTNEGLEGLQYEKSTQLGSKTGTKSEIGDDFLAQSDDFLGSRAEQQMSIMENEFINQRVTKIQNKPFKISDLKRNNSKLEQNQIDNNQTNQQSQQQQQSQTLSSTLKKPRQGLSMKEKRRIEEEEAILKKNSKNQQNQIWKVNDPVGRQLEQTARQNKEKKREQIEKIERSLNQISKKMSSRNKLKVIALVNANDTMQDMIDNQPMTEYDIELAEKEAMLYEIERKQRMAKLQDLIDDSVDDLSRMSASDIRNRALFITEFGKNKSSMQQSFYSQYSQQSEYIEADKLNKQEKQLNNNNNNEQEVESEEEKELDNTQDEEQKSIHKERKNGRNFIKKNITNAYKTEAQQADEGIENFLSEVARERLQELMSGCDEFDLKQEEDKLLSEGNPFGLTKEQEVELKELQEQLEKIRMDDNTIQQLLGHELFSLKDAILPKDPHLKDETEVKILREKMNSVNERLKDLFDVDKRKDAKSKVGNKVEKIKIQNLLVSMNEQGVQNLPTIEIENLIDDFEENQRLLDESRRILADLQCQDIEKELSEYNTLLLEAITIQKQYEQMMDISTQNALMEEQCEIIDSFKLKFEEINQTQKEIQEKEKNFVQFIKENNYGDLLGIQFNENNDDYEVEDIKKIEQEEQEKLQREIQVEIEKINKRYDQFEETEIDDKMKEMQEYDDMITQKLTECNPHLLDDLRESIIQEQEQEEIKRSTLFQQKFNATRQNQSEASSSDYHSEEEEDDDRKQKNDESQPILNIKLENNYGMEKIENTIKELEEQLQQEQKKEPMKQQYFENMKLVKEREQKLQQLNNNKRNKQDQQSESNETTDTPLQTINQLTQQNSEINELYKDDDVEQSQIFNNENSEQNNQLQFEDSLEM